MAYETQGFNIACTRVLQYPYSEPNQHTCSYWHLFFSWYILTLSSYLCLSLPRLFPVGLPVKILKAFLPSSILITRPAHLLDVTSLTILGERYKLLSPSLLLLLLLLLLFSIVLVVVRLFDTVHWGPEPVKQLLASFPIFSKCDVKTVCRVPRGWLAF